MKIGILTVPFNNNYGGFLQAFALKTILSQMGHEVIIINRKRNKVKGVKNYINRLLFKIGLTHDKKARKIEKLSINTNQFKQKYLLPITEEYYTSSELIRCLKLDINCFIVGSDQVWRYKYAKESITDFFCGFLKGTQIKRFSYAASFGIDELEYPQKVINECKLLLDDFNGISVREKSAIDILVNNFRVKRDKIKFVLDPTLLLDSNIYLSLFRNRFSRNSSPYLFTYILDENNEKSFIIKEIQSFYDLDRVDLKAQTGDINNLSPIAHVEEWLSNIYYADFIITDSYHGTVFSIIFNKPFLVYGNSQRGISRFSSLLTTLGLENRYIENKEHFSISLITDKIYWNKINDKIKLLKLESLSFLNNQLSI